MTTPERVRVGLVVVSHSADLARGVVELAGQMAPDVVIVPAGGTADARLGTDFDAVAAALEQADLGGGAALLYDLGSAKMVADLAVEARGDAERAVVVNAPIVEGAVAAAVAAQGFADLAAVARAAESAGAEPVEVPDLSSADQVADVRLTNEIGLHARPAALLAMAIADLDARVTVALGDRKADARSVLTLMALGAKGGDIVRISAAGPEAAEALRRIQQLANRRFNV